MAQKPTLHIRFTFNRSTGEQSLTRGAKRSRSLSFAHTVIEEVGIAQANESYNNLKGRVRNQIRASVQAELSHISFLYQRFVIGRQRRRFQGTLTSLAATGYDANGNAVRSGLSLDRVMEPWSDWAPGYKRWKIRHHPPARWFQNTGHLGQLMRSTSWEEWFGPIRISVERNKDKSYVHDAKGTFSVGRISVRVFGSITPEMLPALSTGNPATPNPTDGRTSGLIGLIARHNPDAANRLAGAIGRVPYRESLEPFLAFVLTRSVPSAVFNTVNRIAGDAEGTGSAGRTR